MLQKMKEFLTVTSSIVGILSFIGISATGLWAFVLPVNQRMLLVVVVAVLVAVILYLYFSLRSERQRNRAGASNTGKPKRIKPSIHPVFEDFMPADGEIVTWYKTLSDYAKGWDDRAIIRGFTIDIAVFSDGHTSYQAHMYAISKRKNLEGTFKLWNLIYKNMTKVDASFNKLERNYMPPNIEPFYIFYPGWRRALWQLFGTIEQSPKESLHITVGTTHYGYKGDPKLDINFHHKFNDVYETHRASLTEAEVNHPEKLYFKDRNA